MNTQSKRATIAAVVVTFNRKTLLIECLRALLAQEQPLDHIYLIDNASTDGTQELLKRERLMDDALIEYVRLPENTGGAGGFHEGIKLAHQAGYDWIWVMDDDAEPAIDALSMLFDGKDPAKFTQYSGLCGIKMGLDDEPQYLHRGLFDPESGPRPLLKTLAFQEQEISYASFVGLLINAKAADLIGYPIQDFFIWYDDVEYCQRMMRYGPILYRPKSSILHKDGVMNADGNSKKSKLLKAIPYATQWKHLCGFRNFIYLMMHHSDKGISWAIWRLLRKIARVLLQDEKKFKLIIAYFFYWRQGAGFIPFKTIKPAEWNDGK